VRRRALRRGEGDLSAKRTLQGGGIPRSWLPTEKKKRGKGGGETESSGKKKIIQRGRKKGAEKPAIDSTEKGGARTSRYIESQRGETRLISRKGKKERGNAG